METIFKVGDKVYDSVVFPNVEGEVISISNDNLIVKVEGMNIEYDLKGALYGHETPTLSFTPYEIKVNHERPVQLPEIGSLCAFSDNGSFDYYHVGELNFIHPIGSFTTKDGTSWRYCKQIETIKFK